MRASPHLRLPPNTDGRDIFIGDLHGELDLLTQLLGAMSFDAGRDRLIAVGDLIDRGPKCLELIDLYTSSDWFYCVLGNHEAMCMDAWYRPHDPDRSWRNGWPYDGWYRRLNREEQERIVRATETMPLTIEVPVGGNSIGVVHADAAAAWPDLLALQWSDVDSGDEHATRAGAACLWGRTRARAVRYLRAQRSVSRTTIKAAQKALQPVVGIDLMVCGHTIMWEPRKPMRAGNVLFLDTGAFERGGALTCTDIASGTCLQIKKSGGRAYGKPRVVPLPEPLSLTTSPGNP